MFLLFQAVQKVAHNRLAIWLTVALVAFDAKLLDFSTNGMETGLLFFFLALTIHALLLDARHRVLRLGAGWAGLMWVRPDSCVYIFLLGVGILMFLPSRETPQTRRIWWRMLLLAGLVCTVLYLPWFVWAWTYYGSPVPNTIVAKATNSLPLSFFGLCRDLLLFPFKLLEHRNSTTWTFMPAYAWFGGWPLLLRAVASALGLMAALSWLVPRLNPATRLFSFCFFFGNFFLTAVVRIPYPWYLPPVAVFGYLALGLLFDQALGLASRVPPPTWMRAWSSTLTKSLRAAAWVLVAGQAVVTVCVARQMAVQQELIEDGLRRPIGLWLHEHAKTPGDTVLLEPLGYISYFSGLKMFDYPGLSSREMVAARRRLGLEHENLAFVELKPDWMVLRPFEFEQNILVDQSQLRVLYEPLGVFDRRKEVAAVHWLPGRGYLEVDQTFVLFRRKPDVTAVEPGK
jgi:hypothetical protein